MDFKIKA